MTQDEVRQLKRQRGMHVERKARFQRMHLMNAAAREKRAIQHIDKQLSQSAKASGARKPNGVPGGDRYARTVITPGNAAMLFQHYSALVHTTPILQLTLRMHYKKRRNLARRTIRKGDRIGRRTTRRAVWQHRKRMRHNTPLLRKKAMEQRKLAARAMQMRNPTAATRHLQMAKNYEDQAVRTMTADRAYEEDGEGEGAESFFPQVARALRRVSRGERERGVMLPSEARRAAEEGLSPEEEEDESEIPEGAADSDTGASSESFLARYKWWLLGGAGVVAAIMVSPKGQKQAAEAMRSVGIKIKGPGSSSGSSKGSSPFGGASSGSKPRRFSFKPAI